MNLGTVKDKSSEGFLRSQRTKRLCAFGAVLCVAAVAVCSALAISNRQSKSEPYTAEAVNTATPTATATPKTKAQSGQATVNAEEESDTDSASEASSSQVQTVKMALPLSGGNIIKGYSSDMLLYSQTLKHWCTHKGLDLAASSGAEVLAALDGTVVSVENDSLMGNKVTISHDGGCETVYASLDTVNEGITEGARVLKGQTIGTAGTSAASEASDGAHLHFEVSCNGKSVNPQVYLSDLIK